VTDARATDPAYTLREDKRNLRYWWVIDRADGSVCFRLPRKEWRMAEEILHNLLHGLSLEEDRSYPARRLSRAPQRST
jgi:hypothetical protein